MQDHASLLEYLPSSNRDCQASISATLVALQFANPVRVSTTPLPRADPAQPSISGDTGPITFSDFED